MNHGDIYDDDFEEEIDDYGVIKPPFSIVVGETVCYRCGAALDVAALIGWNSHGEHCFAIYVQQLPDELLHAICDYVEYRKAYSNTADMAYYANHCPSCDALCGDHYLHRPGAVFFPMEQVEAEAVRLVNSEMSITGPVHGSYCVGCLDLILGIADH